MRVALQRKYIMSLAVILLSLFVYFYYVCLSGRAVYTNIITGKWLFFTIVFLTFLNIRKKLSFWPLGRVYHWLTVHIVIAQCSLVVFLLHIDFRMPSGIIEVTLSVLFAIVFVGGNFGLWISRSYPRKLTSKGGSIPYEDVPQMIHELKDKAESLVLESIDISQKSTIADFYNFRLAGFFAQKKIYWLHLFNSKKRIQFLVSHISSVRRYLNEEEIATLKEVELLMIRKNTLDYQYAHMSMLKYWLFIHIPVSYSLVVLGLFHWLLVVGFIGG
jgi:hypothetical protein